MWCCVLVPKMAKHTILILGPTSKWFVYIVPLEPKRLFRFLPTDVVKEKLIFVRGKNMRMEVFLFKMLGQPQQSCNTRVSWVSLRTL